MNEYLGVFWWNQRIAVGVSVSTAEMAFTGTFVSGDVIVLTLNGTAMQKNVYPADTLTTIAQHFAAYINETFVAAWASASAGDLIISGRSLRCGLQPDAGCDNYPRGRIDGCGGDHAATGSRCFKRRRLGDRRHGKSPD